MYIEFRGQKLQYSSGGTIVIGVYEYSELGRCVDNTGSTNIIPDGYSHRHRLKL